MDRIPAPAVVAGINLHKYVNFDWHWFTVQQLDSLGAHFWSVRLLEWLAFAGAIGLLRRSRPAGLLFAGWMFATIFVKWGSPTHGSTVDNSDILRQSIFTIPAALMLIAGTLLLVPRLPQKLPHPSPGAWGTHRLRLGLVAGLVTVFAVVPVALATALPTLKNSDTLLYYTQNGVSLSAPFAVDKRVASSGRSGPWLRDVAMARPALDRRPHELRRPPRAGQRHRSRATSPAAAHSAGSSGRSSTTRTGNTRSRSGLARACGSTGSARRRAG